MVKRVYVAGLLDVGWGEGICALVSQINAAVVVVVRKARLYLQNLLMDCLNVMVHDDKNVACFQNNLACQSLLR